MKNFIFRNRKKLILILFLIFMFLLLLKTSSYGAEVPDNVIAKARELNSKNSQNIIILQDTVSGDFYLPYCISKDSGVNWKYTFDRNTYFITCPSQDSLYCGKISKNGVFSNVTVWTDLNDVPSYIKIQLNYKNMNLVPVFADNDIVYYNVEGHSNGDVFFLAAPPEKQKTLLEVLEQEKGAALQEIVALLPVILSVLVSLIALRKALKMLLAFLRES